MRIIDLYPKDICATLELSLKEIGLILDFMDKSEMKYDGKNEKEVHARDFVKNQLVPLLDRIYEENKQHVS